MAKRSGYVRVFNGTFTGVSGSDAVQKLFAKIPAAVAAPVQAALDAGADDLVSAYKAIAPVASEFEKTPGQLRDSAHREDTDRELSATVVVDAKDAKGTGYAPKVEYGHRTADGGHVAGKPAFWPAYQTNKRRIRSRVSRAVNKAVKSLAPAETI